jgi:hypothetical protein
MPNNPENLCGLVQRRAVKHGMSLDELWKLVFAAIRDGKLDFEFPSGSPYRRLKDRIALAQLWTPDVVPTTEIEMRCNDALRAIENRDAVTPWTQPWVRDMLVSAAAFDKVLFSAHPKQQPGPDPLVDPLADFIKKKYPTGVPRGITRKKIARLAKDTIGVEVSEKTVTRAKKKLLSDGTD